MTEFSPNEAEFVEIDLVIDPDGHIETVHSDEAQLLLQQLGIINVRRASDVEYDPNLSGWTVRFHAWTGVPDPSGVYGTRGEALAAELVLLRRHRLGLPARAETKG